MLVQVYKARFHGTPVAVKAIIGEDCCDAAALRQEAAILECLRHTHIVHYLDCIVAEEAGTVWAIGTTKLPLSWLPLRVTTYAGLDCAGALRCSFCMHYEDLSHHRPNPLRLEVLAGQVLLVTEFMEGGDLGKKICNDKAVPRQTSWYQQGCFIALGIARGLLYLHSRGVVWFDCKPGNVLLNGSGDVAKIADFGLAKILERTHTMTHRVSKL